MNLEIIYEDNHLLIVNKPAGMLSQGDNTGEISILDLAKNYIKTKYNKKGNVFIGLPHRLDRPTSGALILAKTSKALERLNKMFKDGKVKKYYWAVVDDLPPRESGTLTHYLLKDTQKNKVKAYNKPVRGAKEAKLTYKLTGATKNYYLLEIELHTGRHHQIRAQLAKIGLHIKGDLKYGAKRSNPDGGILLHAVKLVFPHPVKKDTDPETGKKTNPLIAVKAQMSHNEIWDSFYNIWHHL